MLESLIEGQVGALRARAAAACLLVCFAGCGTAPPPVSPAVIEAEEQRLLRPFAEKRVVIADTVEVTLSMNFLGSRVGDADIERIGGGAANRVALPGIDKSLHDRRESRGADGVVETYVNKLGGVERPLRVLVGQIEYRALQGLSLRVLPSGSTMTLDVVARGDVTVLAGSQRQDVPELVIRDGLWRGQ